MDMMIATLHLNSIEELFSKDGILNKLYCVRIGNRTKSRIYRFEGYAWVQLNTEEFEREEI